MSHYSQKQIYGSRLLPSRSALRRDPYANPRRPKRARCYKVYSEESHPEYDSKTGRIESIFFGGDLKDKNKTESVKDQDNLSQPVHLDLTNPAYDVARIKLHHVDLPLLTNALPRLPYLPRTTYNDSLKQTFYRFNYAGQVANTSGDRTIKDSRTTHYNSSTTAVYSFECMIRPRFSSDYAGNTTYAVAHTGTNANLAGFALAIRKHGQQQRFYPYVQTNAVGGIGGDKNANTVASSGFANSTNGYFDFDEWMHLLAVKDNTGSRLYVNGELYHSKDYSSVRSDTSMTHSTGLSLGGGAFNEFIGDVGFPRFWHKDRSADTDWYANRLAKYDSVTGLVQEGFDVSSGRMEIKGTTTPTAKPEVASDPRFHCHYRLKFQLGYNDVNKEKQTYERVVNIYPLLYEDGKEGTESNSQSMISFDNFTERTIHDKIVKQIRLGLTDNTSIFFESENKTYVSPRLECGPNQNIWPFVDPVLQCICFSIRPHKEVVHWSIAADDLGDSGIGVVAPTKQVPSTNILRYLGFERGVLTSQRGDQYGWIDRNRRMEEGDYLPSDYVVYPTSRKNNKDDLFLRIRFGGGSNADSGCYHQTTGVLDILYPISKYDSKNQLRHTRWLDETEGFVELQHPIPVLNQVSLQWVHRDGSPVHFQGQQGSALIEFISI